MTEFASTVLKESGGQPDQRVQLVVNVETGRKLASEPGLELKTIYALVTEKVLQVLMQHNICFVGGTSGVGKSELFLEQTSGFDRLGTHFGSVINRLNELSVPFYIIEDASYSDDILDFLEEDETDEDVEKLIAAQVLLVDESLGFVKNDNFESLQRLLDFAKENNKKIIFIGGGPLDSNQQVLTFKEFLINHGETFGDEQGVEFTPSILTAQQAIDMLIIKGFDAFQAKQIVEKLDKEGVPLIMRVIFQNIHNIQESEDWDSFMAMLTKESFSFQTVHLELKGHLK